MAVFGCICTRHGAARYSMAGLGVDAWGVWWQFGTILQTKHGVQHCCMAPHTTRCCTQPMQHRVTHVATNIPVHQAPCGSVYPTAHTAVIKKLRKVFSVFNSCVGLWVHRGIQILAPQLCSLPSSSCIKQSCWREEGVCFLVDASAVAAAATGAGVHRRAV